MVAPRAESIFTGRHTLVGIFLSCPECETRRQPRPLRIETAGDWPEQQAPALVGNPGPLGFIARCDHCGFRVKMHGDRFPSIAMLASYRHKGQR